MLQLIELEPGLYVSPQITAADLAVIAAHGIKSLVNNRPDGEAEDQLPHQTAAAMAADLGLRYLYQPVPGINVADDDVVDAFQDAAQGLPRPILFYCRSGTRCTILWAEANAARLGTDQVIATAANKGYDLSQAREFINDHAQRLAGHTR
jgi:sulfide:quinone oxidoreductase